MQGLINSVPKTNHTDTQLATSSRIASPPIKSLFEKPAYSTAALACWILLFMNEKNANGDPDVPY